MTRPAPRFGHRPGLPSVETQTVEFVEVARATFVIRKEKHGDWPLKVVGTADKRPHKRIRRRARRRRNSSQPAVKRRWLPPSTRQATPVWPWSRP